MNALTRFALWTLCLITFTSALKSSNVVCQMSSARRLFRTSRLAMLRHGSRPSVTMRAASDTVDVVIVGCGLPGRGMGWYHALQLVNGDIAEGRVTDIVEPWFLGAGAVGPGGESFAELKNEWEKRGINFHSSVSTISAPAAGGQKVALISGRTADNPSLLKEVIEVGCTCVYLEKPGAPSVAELEKMAAHAAAKKVPVYMGCKFHVFHFLFYAWFREI